MKSGHHNPLLSAPRRRGLLASILATACFPQGIAAQSSAKFYRIGWITAQRAPSLAPYLDAFRIGLTDLGYVEGRDLVIEYRYADDAIERVPELATELVRVPVDVLVAQGAAAFEIHGLTIPIVYGISADPVSAGFAETLTRPHGNMTGLTFMAIEMNGKRLELLREIIPELRRVAIVGNPEHPGAHLERGFSEATGQRLGLRIDYFPTRNRDELTAALTAIAEDPPQAISVLADGFAIQNRREIIDTAMSHGVPVISGWPVFAQSGAICTYGPRLTESYRRLAYYVDRILKGARPADLPIERPTKFELVVNLESAKALGITIPQSVEARADTVIE
jgi:putative tryptophan/tyrosine transport system substrate-binding protein